MRKGEIDLYKASGDADGETQIAVYVLGCALRQVDYPMKYRAIRATLSYELMSTIGGDAEHKNLFLLGTTCGLPGKPRCVASASCCQDVIGLAKARSLHRCILTTLPSLLTYVLKGKVFSK